MSNKPFPGLMLTQEKPMLAGNPKDSAIASNNQAAERQADLIKATSGGTRHKSKRNKKYSCTLITEYLNNPTNYLYNQNT